MREDIEIRASMVVDKAGEKVFNDMVSNMVNQSKKLKAEMLKETKDIQTSFNRGKKPGDKITTDEAKVFAQADPHFQKYQRNYKNLTELTNKLKASKRDLVPMIEKEVEITKTQTRTGATINENIKQRTKVDGEWGDTTETNRTKAAGFRMEMLSVMFMGMQISRVFSGVNREALAWGGGMDYLNTMLTLATYESLEPFNEALFALGDWVAANPGLGLVAPIGQVAGDLMSWVSQIVLFKDSVEKMKDWEIWTDLIGEGGVFSGIKDIFDIKFKFSEDSEAKTLGTLISDAIKGSGLSYAQIAGIASAGLTVMAVFAANQGDFDATIEDLSLIIRAPLEFFYSAFTGGDILLQDLRKWFADIKMEWNKFWQDTHPPEEWPGYTGLVTGTGLSPEAQAAIDAGDIGYTSSQLSNLIDTTVGDATGATQSVILDGLTNALQNIQIGGTSMANQQSWVPTSSTSSGASYSGFYGGWGVWQDFIARPGQAPMAFSPDDTIMGVKDTSALMGGNTIININVAKMDNSNDIRAIAKEVGRQIRSETTRLRAGGI